MGRRNSAIVLSSDDEDNDRSSASYRSYSKPKSKPFVTLTNAREPKRPRVSGSRSRLSREPRDGNEVWFRDEDFDELLCWSKVPADDWKGRVEFGCGRNDVKELWVDKYAPRCFEELAINKKKVQEVRAWFEERMRTLKDDFRSHVLVMTGQAGVGKSATIRLIASHLGATLCEWNTPTPTVWQEHVHNANAGIKYASKLDEFSSFIETASKYGIIQSTESKSSMILLIDDLPLTNGRAAFRRLQNCLLVLVRSTQIPTVILVTDYSKTDSADCTVRSMEELQLSLENAGACKVAFNPITINSIKKTLVRICREEHCSVTFENIDLIAKASGGDIRHAICSLQLFCMKPDPGLDLFPTNSRCSYTDEKIHNTSALVSRSALLFGRDETLSLFHALGKFLHNKRDTNVTSVSDQDSFSIQENFSRFPLKMDSPEKVLYQAHGQARPITDFLHENVLDFLSDEAMDDAWVVGSYLSDADFLLSSFQGVLTRYNEAESFLQSVAASVAVRGVLFGNSHPSPSRWHSIRRPNLWQVDQSMLLNQKEMTRRRFNPHRGSSYLDVLDIVADYRPLLKWLDYRSSSFDGSETDDECERMSLDGNGGKSSDDEIEEW